MPLVTIFKAFPRCIQCLNVNLINLGVYDRMVSRLVCFRISIKSGLERLAAAFRCNYLNHARLNVRDVECSSFLSKVIHSISDHIQLVSWKIPHLCAARTLISC